ncbi:MAG: hypothetical protein QOH68_764, partial [Nocardioidaceae bacterium]|nr:hypothetical protein [Nocardioidaceae bacterium]
MVVCSAAVADLVVAPHDHVVNLYDDEADVIAAVCSYLAEGLAAGEAAVVVATESHRQAFDAGLHERGIDPEAARASGQYRCLDAAATLSLFMVDGTPDPASFVRVIGGLVTEASAGGRAVRAFGEMVALLWDDGNVVGAIELESLWNELGREYAFSLYCAYPMAMLNGSDDLDAIRHV